MYGGPLGPNSTSDLLQTSTTVVGYSKHDNRDLSELLQHEADVGGAQISLSVVVIAVSYYCSVSGWSYPIYIIRTLYTLQIVDTEVD